MGDMAATSVMNLRSSVTRPRARSLSESLSGTLTRGGSDTGAFAGVGAAAFAAWRLQRPVSALLGLPGATRRFTGSYEAGSFAGNEFPSTSWLADHPRALAPDRYRLQVTGLKMCAKSHQIGHQHTQIGQPAHAMAKNRAIDPQRLLHPFDRR